jgi:hypothetical protein
MLVMSFGAANAEETLLLELNYGNIPVYTPLTTGVQLLPTGAQYIETLRVVTVGNYCRFVSSGVKYQRQTRGPAYQARMVTGADFEINDQVNAFQYDFEQTVFARATCKVQFFAVTEGGGGGTPNGIEEASNQLKSAAGVFSLEASTTPGYESTETPSRNLYKQTKDFITAMETARDPMVIKIQFRNVSDDFDVLSRTFYRAHSNALNEAVLDQFLDLKEDYKALQKLIDEL